MAFAKKPANFFKFKLKTTTSTSCKGCNFLTKRPFEKRFFVKRSWIFKLRFTKDRLSKDFFRKKLQPLAFGVAECQGGAGNLGVDCTKECRLTD